MRPTARDDWTGDPHHYRREVHYRLYRSPHTERPTVICVQDIDYVDYDARRILSSAAWDTEAEALAALEQLLRPPVPYVHPAELANVHAAFSWTYRLDDKQRDAAFARLTIEQIRKVKFTANLLESWATVELMKRIASPTVPLDIREVTS